MSQLLPTLLHKEKDNLLGLLVSIQVKWQGGVMWFSSEGDHDFDLSFLFYQAGISLWFLIASLLNPHELLVVAFAV